MPKYNDFDLDVQNYESAVDFKLPISYDPTAMTNCYYCVPDFTHDILTIKDIN